MTKQEAVWDLHQKGYVYDFQHRGKDLFWVQEKKFINAGDYSIEEQHSFRDSSKKMGSTIVFAVVALYHEVKGILISHHGDQFLSATPSSESLTEAQGCQLLNI